MCLFIFVSFLLYCILNNNYLYLFVRREEYFFGFFLFWNFFYYVSKYDFTKSDETYSFSDLRLILLQAFSEIGLLAFRFYWKSNKCKQSCSMQTRNNNNKQKTWLEENVIWSFSGTFIKRTLVTHPLDLQQSLWNMFRLWFCFALLLLVKTSL